MEKVWGVILAEIVVTGGAQPAPEALLKMLAAATRAQRYELHWGVMPYKVTARRNQFTAITANLQGLPWMLLDLRGRLQPWLLRIGVGIGEIDGLVQEPVTKLDGQGVRLARYALDELHILNSQQVAQRGRGRSRKGSRKARAALTRFCTVNHDFDETANALYTLQDAVVHEMAPEEWKVFALPDAPEDFSAAPARKSFAAAACAGNFATETSETTGSSASAPPFSALPQQQGQAFARGDGLNRPAQHRILAGAASPAVSQFARGSASWNSRHAQGDERAAVLPNSEEDAAVRQSAVPADDPSWAGPPHAPRARRKSASDLLHASVAVPVDAETIRANSPPIARTRASCKRHAGYARHSELMAAASGIEQLVDERFYAVLHTYVEYRKI